MEDIPNRISSAYKGIGDLAGFSEGFVRRAFNGKAITYQSARHLSRVLGIPVECFRIKMDRRGQYDHKKPR